MYSAMIRYHEHLFPIAMHIRYWSRSKPARSVECRGQGMVEYIIVVALIAIAAIAVYSSLGKTARNQTAGIAKELSGNKSDPVLAKDSANAAAGRANDVLKEGMGRYDFSNDAK